MVPRKPNQFSGSVLWILFVATISSIFCSSIVSANNHSLVVGEDNKVQISPGIQVTNSPGVKPGTAMLCERVHIIGLSRVKNLKKYSHSIKLNVSHSISSLRRKNVEVCLHRNLSLAIGMCPQSKWEKVDKGQWSRAISPFGQYLLDVRIIGASPENIELSIQEEFYLYRVIFLSLGVLLLSSASFISKSVVFYYSSAMAVGVILVVLVILFQGMKLLPSGRKSSLAIFIYSSLVGLGSFFLQYVPGLLQSILTELGINEDMYYPLTVFLLAFVVLAGAWMGFWVVSKFVIDKDGSVDISVSHFVAWSIRIFATLMILQSSLDPLLATEALIAGIVVSSILRKIFRLRFLRRLLKKLLKLARNIEKNSFTVDLSPFGNSHEEHVLKQNEDSRSVGPRSRRSNIHSWTSPNQGFSRTPPNQLLNSDVYPSTFHSTPETRKFSKEDWDKFTKDSTDKALTELVSSPDFSIWVATNADRISVTPTSTRHSAQPRRRWFCWF